MTSRRFRLSDTAPQVVIVAFAIIVVQAIGGIILARSLGPADRGVLAALVLWASIAADLAAVGTPSGVAYWAASGRPRAALRYLEKALPAMAAVGVAIYSAIVLLSGRFEMFPLAAVVIMAVWAVGQLVHLPVVRYQQGLGDMTRFNGLRIVAEIGPTIGYAVLAVFGVLSVATGSASITAFMLTATVVGVLLIARAGRTSGRDEPDPVGRSAFWSYSGRSWLSVIATRGNRTVDLLVLTLVAVSVADIGLYAVAVSAALVLSVLGGSLGLDLFPRVASAKEGGDAWPILVRFVGVNAVFSLIAAAGFFVLAGWLVPFVYGQEFTGSVGPARVLVFGAAAVSISRVAGQGLAGLGHPGRVALAEAVGGAITFVGVLYAANRSLTLVAAVATVGYVVTMVMTLGFTWTSAHRKYA